MDYRISYIYPEEERDQHEISTFPLRLMTRDEIEAIVRQATDLSGVEIKPLRYFDRSILIGRHMDTGDYNENCPKLRGPINSLFESYLRTDLDSLRVDYVPRPGFDRLNAYFESFFMSCNTLVQYTIDLLNEYESAGQRITTAPDILPTYSEPLKEAMETMRRVIEGVGWIQYGECAGQCNRAAVGLFPEEAGDGLAARRRGRSRPGRGVRNPPSKLRNRQG